MAPCSSNRGRDAQHARIERLRGLLRFDLDTHYHERLTETHTHLRELNADVARMQARYESFVRARQAAQHSYAGYGPRIGALQQRVARAQEQVDTLMTRQGQLLEAVAVRELALRRGELESFQNKARFAFADSYDRAVKARGNAP